MEQKQAGRPQSNPKALIPIFIFLVMYCFVLVVEQCIMHTE